MSPSKRSSGVIALIGTLLLAGCSSGAPGGAASTSSTSSPSLPTSTAPAAQAVGCRATFADELRSSFADGPAWRRDLQPPGSPVAPAIGAPSPTALGRMLPLQQNVLSRICGYITTSYLADNIELFERIIAAGAPLPGCAGSSASRPNSPAELSPCEQSELLQIAFEGQSGGAPPSPTSVQVQVLSAAPTHVTMEVISFAAAGSESYTLGAWKIDGRWFAASFASGGTGGGASPTGTATPASVAPSSATETTPSTPSSTVSATPDLFVSNAMTDALYTWPGFPATIYLDDNDWISGITWSGGPQSSSGRGTFYTNLSCGAPAASCPPTAEGTFELSATEPETCTVTVTDPQTGNRQPEQAYVYNKLQYRELSGPQPGKVVDFNPACS